MQDFIATLVTAPSNFQALPKVPRRSYELCDDLDLQADNAVEFLVFVYNFWFMTLSCVQVHNAPGPRRSQRNLKVHEFLSRLNARRRGVSSM